jgi:hypothetical protein
LTLKFLFVFVLELKYFLDSFFSFLIKKEEKFTKICKKPVLIKSP